MNHASLLEVRELTLGYGGAPACEAVSFDLYPGEVLGIVGESGAGKSSVLKGLSGQLPPTAGTVRFRTRDGALADVWRMDESARRQLLRSDWGVIHQNPRDGLRFGVSAGGNVGERLMAVGARHYGDIRAQAAHWLTEVEIPLERLDDDPAGFSGGMQQRVQIARNLVTRPRLVFMDEPTGGLDVSVQARLLDLIRRLTRELHIAAILVTHDLGVVRLLADRLMVMKAGRVVEHGLTDQVLDDPQHAYSQLLVASILRG